MARVLLSVAAWVLAATAAEARDVADCSRIEVGGARTLCVEVVVAADVASVWALWGDPGQLQTWLAPVAAIDLRPGGVMEASYDAAHPIGDSANILNRVVAVAPGHSFAIQIARPPPGFAHGEEARQLVTLIEFEPVGDGSTRVRTSMFGFREGAAFSALYEFFARGNAWTMQKLSERVANGPVDWSETAR